ncbi:hypothetical protein H0H92_008791 [Tricholoma furcatifolium]|nr:hypothetical protein H0H92_008791 [Tricholoma furcatifolium]
MSESQKRGLSSVSNNEEAQLEAAANDHESTIPKSRSPADKSQSKCYKSSKAGEYEAQAAADDLVQTLKSQTASFASYDVQLQSQEMLKGPVPQDRLKRAAVEPSAVVKHTAVVKPSRTDFAELKSSLPADLGADKEESEKEDGDEEDIDDHDDDDDDDEEEEEVCAETFAQQFVHEVPQWSAAEELASKLFPKDEDIIPPRHKRCPSCPSSEFALEVPADSEPEPSSEPGNHTFDNASDSDDDYIRAFSKMRKKVNDNHAEQKGKTISRRQELHNMERPTLKDKPKDQINLES